MLVGLCRVAYRHYHSVTEDFRPAPPADVLFHPERVRVVGIESVNIDFAQGSLAGWYVPSRNRAAVVITHGTNNDRSSMLGELQSLAEAGFGVLAFDWPGCGLSPGALHWNEQERQALATAVSWLESRPDVDPGKIGGLGFSMGSYVMALESAQDKRLRAVVLEGTPTGYRTLIHWQNRQWGALSELPADWAMKKLGVPDPELRPIDVISQIAPRPLLLVTGDQDGEVPTFMAQQLLDAAGSPKSMLVVRGAGHGEYGVFGGTSYHSQLVEFFTAGLLAD